MSRVFQLALFAAFAATPALAEPCTPGTYSASGQQPCVYAPAGSYVPTSGATSPTLVPPGGYQPYMGQPFFYYTPSGSYTATAGATEPTLASPGYYVPYPGATGQTPAPPGGYVPNAGATAYLLAPAGGYQPYQAQQFFYYTPSGSYTASAGATQPTLASPGYYVPYPGATGQTAASPGYYVATAGASAPTAAAPGQYVPGAAATAAILASPGFYVAGTTQTAQTAAPIGSFVPSAGAAAATLASPGYFVPAPGQSSQIAAPAGAYSPVAGLGSPFICPFGSDSYGAASACRAASYAGPGTVGPVFNASLGSNIEFGPVALGDIAGLDLVLGNSASFHGTGAFLADLTLLGFTLTGDAADFQLSGFNFGSVLGPGGMSGLSIRFEPAASGSRAATLTILTDERAGFGQPGQRFTFNLSGFGTSVPEPATWLMLSLGFGLAGAALRRRSATTARG